MFGKNKIECQFKDVPVNQEFYTARFHGAQTSRDSIRLVKVNVTQAESHEWPRDDIHPDQPCRYYLYT